MMRKRINALNAQRQKALVADTQRLVKLASELNAEINSSHQAQLTPDQLRTIAEIEKLAHSVKQKMSTPVAPPPTGGRLSPVSPLTIP